MGPTMLKSGRKAGYEPTPQDPGMGPRHVDPVTAVATASGVVDDVGSILNDVGGFLGIGERIGPCEQQMKQTLEAIKAASAEDVRQARLAIGESGVRRILDFPPQSRFCDLGPIPGACAGGGFKVDAFQQAGGDELKPVAHRALDAAGVNGFPDMGCSECIPAAKVLLGRSTDEASGGGGGQVEDDGGTSVWDRLYETFLQDPLQVLEARVEGALATGQAGAEANDPRNRGTVAVGTLIAVGLAVVAAVYFARRS